MHPKDIFPLSASFHYLEGEWFYVFGTILESGKNTKERRASTSLLILEGCYSSELMWFMQEVSIQVMEAQDAIFTFTRQPKPGLAVEWPLTKSFLILMSLRVTLIRMKMKSWGVSSRTRRFWSECLLMVGICF